MSSTRSARAALLAGALGLALATAPAQAEPVKLEIDAQHSTVGFKVRHLFTKVAGQFRRFEGTIAFDPASLAASSVSVTIQADSVDTNVEARDKDLVSKRFFDVAKFPTLTFVSTGISDVAAGKGKIRGTLTMHGVSREVVLDAQFLGSGKDPWGNQRYGFQAQVTINRKDFGMAWNEVVEAGGVLVGDEVEISLDVEAVPAS
ncbi:MAG: YceI family protein [Vicinamibacteria bacterium]